jgi:hypothetical protein
VSIFYYNLLSFYAEKKRVCRSGVPPSFILNVGVFFVCVCVCIYIYINVRVCVCVCMFVSLFVILFGARRPSSDLPLAACHLFACGVDVSYAWLRS